MAEVTDVQQVTTRSKGKVVEWEAQEAIRKQASEWIKKTKCGGDNRQYHAARGSSHTTRGEPGVASTRRMSDHATISTFAPVGTTNNRGSTGNHHQTKANTGTDGFLQPGRRTDRSRHKQPGNHSNSEGQGNHRNDHRRRIRSKCHQ